MGWFINTQSRPAVTPRSTIPVTSTIDPTPPEETLRTDGGKQMYDVTLEVQNMDITTPEQDIYHGVYPDFQLPLPNRPHVSDLFACNTQLVLDTNSPMSILHIPSLKRMYGTTEFAIDRNTVQLYTIRDENSLMNELRRPDSIVGIKLEPSTFAFAKRYHDLTINRHGNFIFL